MRQGRSSEQVTRVDPALRQAGEVLGDELREATLELGRSFGAAWPSPVFKTLNPNASKNYTPATLGTAIVSAARHPKLQRPAFNRFRSRVVSAIDALVVPIPTDYMSAHLSEAKADGEADVAKVELGDAMRTGNVPALRDTSAKIRRQIAYAQELAASIDARIIECTQSRGHWA